MPLAYSLGLEPDCVSFCQHDVVRSPIINSTNSPHPFVATRRDKQSPILLKPCALVLEDYDGRMQTRQCPVFPGRFLIGASEQCDLRLGGDDMPALHSILHVHGDEFRLEALSSSPPIRVNGTVMKTVLLADGDVIEIGEIGPFQFIENCRLEKAAEGSPDMEAQQTGKPQNMLPFPADDRVRHQDLEHRSAAELVELIEQEQKVVRQFESRRRLVVEALLAAVRERADSAAGHPSEPGLQTDPDELSSDLGVILKHLTAWQPQKVEFPRKAA